MNSGLIALVAVAGAVGVFLAVHVVRRFSVAVLTVRARAWVPSVSRLLSSWVNAHDYSGDAFFRADGANAGIVRRRLEALDRVSASFRDAHAKSADWGASVREGFSDIRFADANRVPFPFAKTMREKFDLTTVVTESDGPHLQMLHPISSSVFLYCYAILAFDLTEAMCLGLAALFVRQFGHAVLEPDAHEKEMSLLGYTTQNKTLIVLGYTLIPVATLNQAGSVSLSSFMQNLPTIAQYWWHWTQFVIGARIAYLIWKFSFRPSMVWYIKLVTDPMTDIVAYFPRRQRA